MRPGFKDHALTSILVHEVATALRPRSNPSPAFFVAVEFYLRIQRIPTVQQETFRHKVAKFWDQSNVLRRCERLSESVLCT